MKTAEEVYTDIVAAIHRADPADAVVQIRSYAEEVREEAAKVAEENCHEYPDIARAIRSIKIK